MFDWLFRFIKGLFIGSGFILPGVSGGALAAVFGLYTRIVGFLAHPLKHFHADLRFFAPVALGGAVGVFGLSFAVTYLLGAWEVQVLWGFVGCILGMLPALWRQAGMHGRKKAHAGIAALSGVISLVVLLFGTHALGGSGVAPNFWWWLVAGALIALGVLVPGLSPSNFLVYLGLYHLLAKGIQQVDWAVLMPVALGGLLCLASFSKLMNWAFSRWYAGLFHAVFGLVAASTVMIVPRVWLGFSWGALACVIACALGAALGWWMSDLERRYQVA